MDYQEEGDPSADILVTAGPSTASNGREPNKTQEDGDWQTVLTLRQRKEQAKQKQNQTKGSGQVSGELRATYQTAGTSPFTKKTPIYKKLPPLPEEDFKVIVRPHKGLAIRDFTSPPTSQSRYQSERRPGSRRPVRQGDTRPGSGNRTCHLKFIADSSQHPKPRAPAVLSRQCASAVAAAAGMSQDDVIDAVDMTPEEIIDWREKFVYSDTKRPSPTSPSTLKTRPQVSHDLPRPPPLPAAEYKIILRVHGGVNCANIHPVSLRDIVIKSTGLSAAATSLDRLRANEINNTIIISTPCMDRADRYLKIATLTIMDKSYEVSTHVADPKNSCRGIIKLPASLVEGNVLVKLRDSNPTIKILAARRMGSTDSILVTFEGSKVPFYIDYLRTDLRCRPYRQKVEACARCRQLGHRQDVCPNVTICLCPKCGTPDPPEDHSCTPTCIICNGTHETGSSECRLRYKPRTPPPAPPETKLTLLARNNIQASNQHPGQEKPQSNSGRKNSATAAQVLASKQAWPPLTPRNEERPPINHTKVSWAGVVSHNSSSSLDADNSLIKYLLNQNEILKAEIKQLKAMLHPPPHRNQ
ncbi:hypothetical protein HPB49_002636 [Dermacentor silvarum]|uniref:Uncharacterized protein n=1 Tax=Dermacentor silvarum TaxID=543639 RepID=A0ACB8DA22_DERSI|nr:hypothetical protein HPB49_002636 [Dermacentor silvarum]